MEQRGGLEGKREEEGGNNKEEAKTVLAKIKKLLGASLLTIVGLSLN